MAHLIELQKVSKYYATKDNVSLGFSKVDLVLDKGEFVAITGESGSGKSTLLNVISGLDTYDEGEMFIAGEDTSAFDTEDYEKYRKKYIGNIFQEFHLINSYTVYQNIELVMLLNGRKKKSCRKKIRKLLKKVGMLEYANTKASKLSGGQKQRVAIARALAKDAPIIVADEPTGNLDSESAANIIDILHNIAKDRLVVIVTHNYEQVEHCVTRKLTMNDGRLIENKVIREPEAAQPEQPEAAAEDKEPKQDSKGKTTEENTKMRKGSELRLGLRNTFNLPVKFILLLIVYLFVATSVLGQYASVSRSLHEEDILGYNDYFYDTDTSRVVLTKADKKPFTDADMKTIRNTDHVKTVVPNDIAIDTGVSLEVSDYYFDGCVYPQSMIAKKEIAYGTYPKEANDIVICIDKEMSDLTSDEEIKSIIGKEARMYGSRGCWEGLASGKFKIVGVALKHDGEYRSDVYVSEKKNKEIRANIMAGKSKGTLYFDDKRMDVEAEMRAVYASDHVPSGSAYISEDVSYYYDEGRATGHDLKVKVENSYFTRSLNLTVDRVVKSSEAPEALGISKTDMEDNYYNGVFISTKDYNKLYGEGNYQVSIYLDDEINSGHVTEKLQAAGFKTLAMKDALSDLTDGFSVILRLLSFATMILELIILFFISYVVIKLIMKSRNSYYSILRMLGATKKSTDNILRIELLLVMLIAYLIDLATVSLQGLKIINIEPLNEMLPFLKGTDYIILGAILMVMSLLIANRYSKKIFTDSAMQAYREEA